MPTPDRTSLPAIVDAGLHILETEGLGAVTMAAVAARVGVRPPSLYKRVRNRGALIRLIAESVAADLGESLENADPGGPSAPGAEPRVRLSSIVRELRSFACERPAAYRLIFTPLGTGDEVSPEVLESASVPLFDIVATLVDPHQVLLAARTLTAWATGFIAMETSGAFRLGGDVDAAFEYGIESISAALTRPSSA